MPLLRLTTIKIPKSFFAIVGRLSEFIGTLISNLSFLETQTSFVYDKANAAKAKVLLKNILSSLNEMFRVLVRIYKLPHKKETLLRGNVRKEVEWLGKRASLTANYVKKEEAFINAFITRLKKRIDFLNRDLKALESLKKRLEDYLKKV